MLRRDLIMTQIEEFGKVIAQIISQRNTNAAKTNTDLILSVYNLLKIDKEFILNHSIEEIILTLNGDDMAGIQRLEITAKLLLEDSYHHPDEQLKMRLKAKEMLEYIQTVDTTFSLERIHLIEEIKKTIEQIK